MEWKKPSPALSERLAEAMGAFDVTKKPMFGCPAYFVNGQMISGVFGDDIFLRFSKVDCETFKSKYEGATAFEPIKGRPMKEYVVIPPQVYEDDAVFKSYIGRSMGYARSLPPKPQKAKKK